MREGHPFPVCTAPCLSPALRSHHSCPWTGTALEEAAPRESHTSLASPASFLFPNDYGQSPRWLYCCIFIHLSRKKSPDCSREGLQGLPPDGSGARAWGSSPGFVFLCTAGAAICWAPRPLTVALLVATAPASGTLLPWLPPHTGPGRPLQDFAKGLRLMESPIFFFF